MDPKLQAIADSIQRTTGLTDAEKELLLQSVKDADKAQSLSKFKLERLEHDKQTLSVMLEESIEDLQKKSKAVELQNRELEIEAALERVRAVALSMMKPEDMLEVCKTIALQLESLRVKEIRNVQTAIFDEAKKMYFNYEFYSRHNKTLVTEVNYSDHPVAQNFADQMLKGPNQVWAYAFKGQEVKDWLNYQKGTNVFIDTYLENADTLNYYWYSLGPVGIGMSAYSPLKEEEIELFKRFRNVFELAYRRYLDIEKAEAQAREAEIQLALERVRARTMAMQHSNEHTDAAMLMFRQLEQLGVDAFACGFVILDKGDTEGEFWMSSEGVFQPPHYIPHLEEPSIRNMYMHWKNGEESYAEDVGGEALKSHYRYLMSLPKSGSNFQGLLDAGITFPEWQRMYAAYFSHGYLLIITKQQYKEEAIFTRFAKVFEQTYTRFLDLQKAEAQARESQIQLALERVRARTMAMQRSEELSEAVYVLFQQFRELGEDPDQATIGIVNEEQQVIEYWVTMYGSQMDRVFKFSIDEPHVTNRIYKAWKAGDKSLVIDLSGKELYEFTTYRESMGGAKRRPEEKRRVINVAFFSKGLLNVQSNETRSDESIRLLERFATVFDQTYTRFIDLQRAEAQAREAEVQLALERVRARSMAMYKSDELHEVAEVLFQQLLGFGGNILNAGIALCKPDSDEDEFWVSSDSGIRPMIAIPHTDDPIQKKLYEGWKNKLEFYSESKGGDELKAHYNYLASVPSLKPFFEEGIDSNRPVPKWQKWHAAYFSHGYVFLMTLEEYDEEKILTRFAKIFEQAYTRFLDLQTAEAQARESQIQLALERVRARTMAMQKSEDLTEVVAVIYEQLQQLGFVQQGSCNINIMDVSTGGVDWWMTGFGNQKHPHRYHVSYINHPVHITQLAVWKSGKKYTTIEVAGESKKEFDKLMLSQADFEKMSEETKTMIASLDRVIFSMAFMKYGALSWAANPITDEQANILQRFARVFEQTYTRFLDLQKAEANARESQIEAALERVRSRAMGMHKADDLNPAVAVVFEELDKLKLGMLRCGIGIIDGEKRSVAVWTTSVSDEKNTVQISGGESMDIHPLLQGAFNAWLKQSDFSYTLQGGDLLQYYKAVDETNIRLPQSQSEITTQYYYVTSFDTGGLFAFRETEFSEEGRAIMKRFANVFNLTYKRFLDLQKAEAQAREAKIEAALEKVRSRSLAMHRSEELQEVVHTVFEKLRELNVDFYTVIIVIFKENSKDIIWWMENRVNQQYPRILVRYADNPYLEDLFEAKESGKELFSECYFGEGKNKFYNHLFQNTDLKHVDEKQKEFLLESEFATMSVAIAKNTGIHLTSYSKRSFSEEENEILKRFAKVFEQAYIRFMDLQKAEAQAREAQIEAALERVRSRTMGMQRSEELKDVIQLVYDQFIHLSILVEHTGFIIDYKERSDMNIWLADQREVPFQVTIPYFDCAHWNSFIEAKEKGKDFFANHLPFEEKNKFYQDLFKVIPGVTEEAMGYYLSCPALAISTVLLENVGLYIENFSGIPYTDEENNTLMRFGKVFQQTYTRFLDLQKAEAQARQAKIEAAMEKVRSRAMAMQRPAELVEVAKLLRTEMGLLGVEELETSSIYIHNESTRQTECWYAIQKDGKLVSDHMTIDLQDTWVGREMLAFYRSDQKQTSIVMQGEPRKEWINYCADHSKELVGFYGDVIPDRTYHLYKFSNGYMGAASPGSISTESWDLLQRATSVFSLAYTRFSDLQLAEAQAREAQVETALERVRSRTLAMQKSDELAETASELFKQLIHLGIEPNRLYICIMTDEIGEGEFWITDEDGSKISMAYSANLNENPSMKKMYEAWKAQNKTLMIDMQGKELQAYFKHLNSLHVPFKGGLAQQRRLQYIAYFSKGFIGMASPDEQPAETMQLLERFAAVFNLTFTRFSDLKIAEAHALQAEEDLIAIKAAKKRAEDTLTELQATQNQLVQSEKMASLGELTAGIAHEIQNPLNFVNNFSDVSSELLDEMKTELEKGNTKDAAAIVDDVKQNLEKILHHGRRADAIVKGMLQHSRTSTGQKELTDINVLADEYLRLAYHGLRAKDKSFNAKFETDFDKSAGKINVMPQEIGRVILNLINNAFYTVSEKQKRLNGSFEPTVLVSTKKVDDKLQITVADNGNGIPQKNLDKIFQPFFTTKPTGEGTGLGLSLAYDIVTKGHGGELNVKTKEGEGSEFTIQLPST